MCVAVVVGAAAVLAAAVPAEAKGASMYPIENSHEPGDTVTLIGYTTGGRVGDVEDEGPFQAYLLMDEGATPSLTETIYDADDIALGRVGVTDAEAWGQPALRAQVTFTLPADLPPGTYNVLTCGRGCTSSGPGDLFGGFVDVGVDTPVVYERMWPPTEPAIAELPDDAPLVDMSGNTTTVADVHGGRRADADADDRAADSGRDDRAVRRGHETAVADSDDGPPKAVGIAAGGLALVGATALWTWRRRGEHVVVDDGEGGGDDGAAARTHRL